MGFDLVESIAMGVASWKTINLNFFKEISTSLGLLFIVARGGHEI